MRIALLGSWRQSDQRDWQLRETPEAFADACRQLGRTVIERGHSLVVGSDSRHTADAHAVAGALDALKDKPIGPEAAAPIMLIRPSDESEAFDDASRSRPDVFVEDPVDASSWTHAKVFQTKRADAVILVGGAEKTEQAGLTAAVSGKPLACIGSFGGAARKLNDMFLRSLGTWGYDEDFGERVRKLQGHFSDNVKATALEIAGIEGAPKLFIIHGRSLDRDVLKRFLTDDLNVSRVIVLADEFAPTEAILSHFERNAASADGAIALLTPDDAGGLASMPGEVLPRARENVWVEVGWFWGRRGRSKLLILRKGQATIPSDLGNVVHFDYDADPREREKEIRAFVNRLRSLRT